MIYHFKTTVQDGKNTIEKDLYLTADNEKAFYRRAADQYGVNIRNIEILEEIEDESIDINTDIFKKKDKSESVVVEDKEPSIDINIAEEILNGKVNGLTEEQIKDRCEKGWKYKELLDPVNDLAICLKRYKRVKIYYLRTGMKKNKKYIVLYK